MGSSSFKVVLQHYLLLAHHECFSSALESTTGLLLPFRYYKKSLPDLVYGCQSYFCFSILLGSWGTALAI